MSLPRLLEQGLELESGLVRVAASEGIGRVRSELRDEGLESVAHSPVHIHDESHALVLVEFAVLVLVRVLGVADAIVEIDPGLGR